MNHGWTRIRPARRSRHRTGARPVPGRSRRTGRGTWKFSSIVGGATCCVLENVKHLVRHDQGRTFQIIHDTLTNALGYQVYWKVIDAQKVVPQHRQRIFLVGFKPGRAFEFPEFPAEGPKLASILDPDAPEKYTLTDHLWN